VPVTQSPQQTLLDRLANQSLDHEDWALDILAACEGPEALARLLDDGIEPRLPARTMPPKGSSPSASREAKRVYLRSITVQSFRGIGQQTTLDLLPGPGLSLVIGSGKSSFAEALEVLFTGESARWSGKNKFWKRGWRNLHDGAAPQVGAELFVEGAGVVTLERRWSPDSDVDEADTRVQRAGHAVETLAETGWGAAVKDYRPFMSHSELESMLEDGPSVLYRALLSGLGLEEFEIVRQTLAKAHSARKDRQTDVKDRAKQLIARCQQALAVRSDDRVGRTAALLAQRTWDPDTLSSLVTGDAGDETSELAWLDSCCQLDSVDIDRIGSLARDLRETARRVEELGALEAGRARDLASLLEAALRATGQSEAADCPVCGTADVIDAAWRTRTEAEARRLRHVAADLDVARQRLNALVSEARVCCHPLPSALADARADRSPALVAAREAWTRWSAGRGLADAGALTHHFEVEALALHEAVDAAVTWARGERARREDVWRPIGLDLARWLPDARLAAGAKAQLPRLKAAGDWVAKTIGDLREERFRPVETRALENWSRIRLQSNVELTDIALTGRGKQQSVELKVAVDGEQAGALGVMSQGELNALILSLFLPRALLPDNPFGFVIVDDPVQAMDPARVEGLAQLLASAAKERQVVVFTHDDRLPEAVRRLQIEARTIEVTRRARSVVELKLKGDPVDAYLDDARALMKAVESDGIPDGVVQSVVPGFCRSAIEAACTEAIRRRRLKRGDPHADVEALLEKSRVLSKLMTLALFDTPERGGDTLRTMGNKWGQEAVDVYKQAQGGAHGERVADLEWLVKSTGSLTGKVRALS
jgi:hypothetical protein